MTHGRARCLCVGNKTSLLLRRCGVFGMFAMRYQVSILPEEPAHGETAAVPSTTARDPKRTLTSGRLLFRGRRRTNERLLLLVELVKESNRHNPSPTYVC